MVSSNEMSFKEGDFCPLKAAQVSPLAPGAAPLRVQDLLRGARKYVEDCATLMIESPGEVD